VLLLLPINLVGPFEPQPAGIGRASGLGGRDPLDGDYRRID
jgi:hypothetical protein